MPVLVAVVVSDLMFRARIDEALRALDVEPIDADAPKAFDAALRRGPAAGIVDVHERNLDALGAIRQLSASGAAVLAFGRHTEPQTLRAARDAGAARAVPRSQLVEDLPALLAELVAPRADRPA